MIQSEIDFIEDNIDLSKINNMSKFITILNSKGYDLNLIDNTYILEEQKKLQKFQKKYPLVEEMVLEMVIIHEEEEEFTNNEWVIYLQSEYDSIIKYAKSKKEVQELIQKEIDENSDFDVYEIYRNYKPVDFKIEINIYINGKN